MQKGLCFNCHEHGHWATGPLSAWRKIRRRRRFQYTRKR
jgi:hypothetical protein